MQVMSDNLLKLRNRGEYLGQESLDRFAKLISPDLNGGDIFKLGIKTLSNQDYPGSAKFVKYWAGFKYRGIQFTLYLKLVTETAELIEASVTVPEDGEFWPWCEWGENAKLSPYDKLAMTIAQIDMLGGEEGL